MEDYKEKYEKAVEWLRDGLYAASRGTMKEEMEKYFPELAESEDERIRKAISQCVEDMRGQFEKLYRVHHKDAIAWLESKDIKNKVWIYRDVYVREKEHARKDGIDEVLANPQKYGLEKQGEQKPAEWSEDDKYMAHHIGNAITTHEASCYLEAKNIEVIDAHVWLYSLMDRVQPQEKQEWSEEDEKISKAIIKYINGESDCLSVDLSSAICWIKNVKDRVQPHQELSEEDKTNIDSLLDILYRIKKGKDPQATTRLIEQHINFIESLKERYTWKPSDEEIEILNMVLTNESMDDNVARILRDIREQLKKLKE